MMAKKSCNYATLPSIHVANREPCTEGLFMASSCGEHKTAAVCESHKVNSGLSPDPAAESQPRWRLVDLLPTMAKQHHKVLMPSDAAGSHQFLLGKTQRCRQVAPSIALGIGAWGTLQWFMLFVWVLSGVGL